MRRHIALLFEYPTLNGGERSMLAAIDAIDHSEFRFSALAPASGRLADALADRSIEHRPVLFFDTNGGRLSREAVLDQIRCETESLGPDLLHANSLAMGRLTGALRQSGFPIRCTAHLRDIIGLSRAAIDDLNRNQRLLAVSRATKNFHVGQGLNADRVDVVYNGVDCDRFQPRPSIGQLRDELKLNEGTIVVLNVGQIGLRKAQDVLAEAMIAISDDHSRCHLVVAGERNSNKTESIEFERGLHERFRHAGIGERLHCLGYRDDVDCLMNEADLLVHCPHQEPFGRVLLEASASGLPIVATVVGGTSELLTDGVDSRLVPAGDVDVLADTLRQVIDDGDLRLRLATAARRTVTERFTQQMAADSLAALWRDVADQESDRESA